MLNNISKYKYIRDTILYTEDNQARATIDDQVLGIRDQVCLPKLVDCFYLNELKSIHDTVLENTVDKPGWPVRYDEDVQYKLPEPQLGNYFDVDKLDQVQMSDDIFENKGGDNIDYDKFNKEFEAENNSYDNDIQGYEKTYKEEDQAERDKHEQKVLEFNNREKSINDRYNNTSQEYADALKKAQDDLDDNNQKWQKKVDDLLKEYQNGNINKGEFNTKRQQLENEFYDFKLDYYVAIQTAMLGFNDTNMAKLDELQMLEKERNDELKQFNQNIQTIKKNYDDKMKARSDQHKETGNDIYLRSNGQAGIIWSKNREKMEKDLQNLEFYNARNNVSNAIPWIPLNKREWFVEYNDRLYADWEKCIWRKETANMTKIQDGYMEQYSGRQSYDSIETEYGTLSGYTVSNNFSRWHSGDAVMVSRNYTNADPKASESSQFSFSYEYKLRVGNRHDQGNITEVKILGMINGYGEGSGGSENTGYHYGVVTAHKDSIAQEKYLNQIDEEDDTNVANLQDLEEKYNKAKYKLDNDLLINQDALKYKLDEDILKKEHDLNSQIREITGGKMQSISSLQLSANTMKFNGEDNTQLLNQINEQINELNDSIATAKEQYDKDVVELKKKYDDDKKKLDDDYVKELDKLNDEKRVKVDEENKRHDDRIKVIKDDYQKEYDKWNDDAQKEYTDKVNSAKQELDAFFDGYEAAKRSWDAGKVQQWNDKYAVDYPEAELSAGYSIIDNGVPLSVLGTFDERKDAWNAYVKAAYDWSVGWYGPTNAANDKYDTSVANANKELAIKLNEFDELNLNQREVWKFSINDFAVFADKFTDEQQTEFPSAWGEKGAFGFSALQVWIKTDYKANTGVEYPDYFEEDYPNGIEEGVQKIYINNDKIQNN